MLYRNATRGYRAVGAAWAGMVLLVIAGCGGQDDLPSNVAAEVGDSAITERSIEQLMIGQAAVGTTGALPYRPTDVEGCVAAKLRQHPGGASRAAVEAGCKQQRTRRKEAALRLAIQGRWYALEARRRGLAIPKAPANARALGKRAGVKPQAMRELIEASLLKQELLRKRLERLAAAPPSVSRAQIARHYSDHRERYVTPEARFVQAIVVPSQAQARTIAAKIRRDLPWEQVVRQSSRHGAREAFTGLLPTDLAGGRTLERQARQMRRGEVGTIRTQRGWFVFRLVLIRPVDRLSVEEAAPTIEADFRKRHEREAIAAFDSKLRERYGEDTVCAGGYAIAECG